MKYKLFNSLIEQILYKNTNNKVKLPYISGCEHLRLEEKRSLSGYVYWYHYTFVVTQSISPLEKDYYRMQIKTSPSLEEEFLLKLRTGKTNPIQAWVKLEYKRLAELLALNNETLL